MIEFDLIRILSAFVCGYALCLSGSLTQIVSNNPLASPSTLGFDGLVVLIVLICHGLVTSLGLGNLQILTFLAFIFILITVALLSNLKRSSKSMVNMNLIILLGLGFNLFVGAVFSVVQFLFMSLNKQFPSGLWFGNFRQADEQYLLIISTAFLFTIFVSLRLAKSLSIMTIDNTLALCLGIDVEKTQRRAIFLSLLLTGLVISFFGVFSFLGLIFPHLVRTLPGIKGQIRSEILFGPILSGLVLLVLDQICYNWTYYGAELPVGMVSSVLGSGLLIAIVIRRAFL